MTGAAWKWISGYEGLYEVSDRGEVCSYHGCSPRILKPGAQPSGHLHVILFGPHGRHNRKVHQLVVEAFVGPRPAGHEVRHLNGVPTDNRWPENIEYSTLARNRQDRKWHRVRGDRSSKLSPSQVVEIRRRAGSETQRALAKEFGVVQTLISKIHNGLVHKDLAYTREEQTV